MLTIPDVQSVSVESTGVQSVSVESVSAFWTYKSRNTKVATHMNVLT